MVNEAQLATIPEQERQGVRGIQERVRRGEQEISGIDRQIAGLQQALSKETDPFQRRQIIGNIADLRRTQSKARSNVAIERSNVVDQFRRAQGKRSVADASARDKVTDADREIMRRARVEQVKRGSGLDKRERERIEREIRQGTFNPTREKLRNKNISTFQGIPIRAKQATVQTLRGDKVIKEERLPANQARQLITQQQRRQQRSRPRRTKGTVPAPDLQGGRNERKDQRQASVSMDTSLGGSSNTISRSDDTDSGGFGSIARSAVRLSGKEPKPTKGETFEERIARIETEETKFRESDLFQNFLTETETIGDFITDLVPGTGTSVDRSPFGIRVEDLTTNILRIPAFVPETIFAAQKGFAAAESTLRGNVDEVTTELKRGAVEVEKGPLSFLPGGTPINREGQAVLDFAVVGGGVSAVGSTVFGKSSGSSSGSRTTTSTAKPSKVPPIIESFRVGESFRIAEPGRSLEIGRGKVEGRQGNQPFEADVGFVRDSRAVQDITVSDAKAGADISIAGENILGRSETKGISKGTGGGGSRFVDFTRTEIQGTKGKTSVVESVSPGRAQEIARIVGESGDTSVVQTFNPTFIVRNKPSPRVQSDFVGEARALDPTSPFTVQEFNRVVRDTQVRTRGEKAPNNLELVKIETGLNREQFVTEIPTTKGTKARLSRIESLDIGLGGRENLNRIAKDSIIQRQAAAIEANNFVRLRDQGRATGKDFTADFFKPERNLQRTRQVQKTQRLQSQRSFDNIARDLVETTLLERPTPKARGRTRNTSKIFLSSQFGTDASLDPFTTTRQATKTKSKAKTSPRQSTEPLFKFEPFQDTKQRQGTGQLFDIIQDTSDAFQPVSPANNPFAPQNNFFPESNKGFFGGKLPPLLQLPSAKKGKKGKGGGKQFKGFKPDLTSLAFRQFGESSAKQRKRLKKRGGTGRRFIGSEFKDEFRTFDKLLEPNLSGFKGFL